jgi:hypothetical protein
LRQTSTLPAAAAAATAWGEAWTQLAWRAEQLAIELRTPKRPTDRPRPERPPYLQTIIDGFELINPRGLNNADCFAVLRWTRSSEHKQLGLGGLQVDEIVVSNMITCDVGF